MPFLGIVLPVGSALFPTLVRLLLFMISFRGSMYRLVFHIDLYHLPLHWVSYSNASKISFNRSLGTGYRYVVFNVMVYRLG